MSVAEKIYEHLQSLPEPLQAEVLDFVGYLESKSNLNGADKEHISHTEISLACAMRGMEDEDLPEYSIDDLKEHF